MTDEHDGVPPDAPPGDVEGSAPLPGDAFGGTERSDRDAHDAQGYGRTPDDSALHERRSADESGASLRLPAAPPDLVAAPARHGVPSFFPADDEHGSRADLDALLPSMHPGARSSEPAPGTFDDDLAQAFARLEPAAPRDSGELVIPGFEAERPSQRPGLLSSVLKQEQPDIDHGATTALRNLPRRARGRGTAGWPAAGPDADRARATLLEHLAERATGPTRARLACAAAELERQAGDPERALMLHEAAHAADPNDVVALRALQRAAMETGATARLGSLLREEANLALPDAERALVWSHLALVEFASGHADAAERAAGEALALAPGAGGSRILLAALHARAGRHVEAAATLRSVAEAWPDAQGRAAWLVEAARLFLRAGDARAALDAAHAAVDADPTAFDALLWSYRLARAENRVAEAHRALDGMRRAVSDPALQAEFTRTSARLAHDVDGDPARALALLEGAGSLPALRQRANAAEALGNALAREQALRAWAEASRGGERAVAYLDLAQLLMAQGDDAGSVRALDDAAAADDGLALVRIAREGLARRSGDPSLLARAFGASAASEALIAASRAASTHGQEPREVSLLDAARQAGAGPIADVIGVDAAADAGAWTDVADGLRREAEQRTGDARAGALLALSDLVRTGRIEGTVADASFADACAAAPDAPHVHARRVTTASTDAERAARWLDRARAITGAAAASAAMLSHVYARRAGIESTPALARALEASPRHLPALWALERAGYAAADTAQIRQSLRLIAERSVDPIERAARRVRLALLVREEDPGAARRLLDEASLERPADGSISALALDLRQATPAAHAEHLDRAAAGASPAVARALQIEAAARYEDAGDIGRASARYLGALDTSEGVDPHARLGLERTLPRTGADAPISQRLEADLARAPDDKARAAALERLAEHRARTGDLRRADTHWKALHALEPLHPRSRRAIERHAMEVDDQAELRALARQALSVLDARADRRAYLTLAWHLMRENDAKDRDALVLEANVSEPDLWLALRLDEAAHRQGDAALVARAARALAARLPDAREQASLVLRAAEAIEDSLPDDARAWLRPFAEAPHPLVAEELGHVLQDDDPGAAAEAYAEAARHSCNPDRKARLLHRAASLWQDRTGEGGKALLALHEVLAIAPTHVDAFARARRLLDAANDTAGLARLLEERLAHPLEPDAALAMETERAALSAQVGDPVRARAALAHALSLAPERVDLLERLAGLHIQAGEHREAAELLVRLARTTEDPALLRRTFFTLGTLYDEHVIDPRRAEIAFTRVATLAPDDPPGLERLASVLRKKGDFAKALRVLSHLADVVADDRDARERCTLLVADTLEASGAPIEAERALETHRRAHPTSARVIDALTDLYTRQSAAGPLAVHLDRTALGLREAIERDPSEAGAWQTLATVLERRGRSAAGHAVAALASTLGLGGDAPARAHTGGIGADALQPGTWRRIQPAGLDAPARVLLRTLERTAEVSLPRATSAVQALPIEQPSPALAEALAYVGRVLGTAPRIHACEGSQCFPVAREPLTLAIGATLAQHADAAELVFLILRAAVLARLDLGVIARTTPGDARRALRALLAAAEGTEFTDDFVPVPPPEFDAADHAETTEAGGAVHDAPEESADSMVREVLLSMAPAAGVSMAEALATRDEPPVETDHAPLDPDDRPTLRPSGEPLHAAGTPDGTVPDDAPSAPADEMPTWRPPGPAPDDVTLEFVTGTDAATPPAERVPPGTTGDEASAPTAEAAPTRDAVDDTGTGQAGESTRASDADASRDEPIPVIAVDASRVEPIAVSRAGVHGVEPAPVSGAGASPEEPSSDEATAVAAPTVEVPTETTASAPPEPTTHATTAAPEPPRPSLGDALGPAERRALEAAARALRDSGVDPASVGDLALDAAARAALAATDDCASALTALFVCADPEHASGDPLDAVRRLPEARALLAFALSDTYLALVHPEDARR